MCHSDKNWEGKQQHLPVKVKGAKVIQFQQKRNNITIIIITAVIVEAVTEVPQTATWFCLGGCKEAHWNLLSAVGVSLARRAA